MPLFPCIISVVKKCMTSNDAQNIKLKQDSEAARNQPSGQLPDLDPGKVSIIQPALNGTNGIIESRFFLNYYFIIYNASFVDLFLHLFIWNFRKISLQVEYFKELNK